MPHSLLSDQESSCPPIQLTDHEPRVNPLRPHLTMRHHLAPPDTRCPQRPRASDPVAYRIHGRYHRLVAHAAVAVLVIAVCDLDPLAIPICDLIKPDHRPISHLEPTRPCIVSAYRAYLLFTSWLLPIFVSTHDDLFLTIGPVRSCRSCRERRCA